MSDGVPPYAAPRPGPRPGGDVRCELHDEPLSVDWLCVECQRERIAALEGAIGAWREAFLAFRAVADDAALGDGTRRRLVEARDRLRDRVGELLATRWHGGGL